jgi:predicted acyl esterase
MIVERDVMIAMRDGVRLATDLYRPEGRRPASGDPRTHALR